MVFWNVDPVAVHIGPVAIRWYGIFFVGGFAAAYLLMRKRFVENRVPLDLLDDLCLYLFLGTLVGARLGHCLFYEPAAYLPAPWRILVVWEGGLASHGGAVGVFLALLLYVRRYRNFSLLQLLDQLVVPISAVALCIRLGNLMNSEILGTPTSLPWAFVFERADGIPRHPAQLYEALAYLVIGILLTLLRKGSEVARRSGWLTGLFFVLVFGFRFVIEFLKMEQVPFEKGLPLNLGQLLSLPFVAVGVWLMVRARPEARP